MFYDCRPNSCELKTPPPQKMPEIASMRIQLLIVFHLLLWPKRIQVSNVFQWILKNSNIQFLQVKYKHGMKLSLNLNRLDTSIDFNVEIQREWDYLAPKRLDISHASKSPVCVYHLEEWKYNLNLKGYFTATFHVHGKSEYNSWVELILITKQIREKVSLVCLQERGHGSGAIAPVLNSQGNW